MGKAKFQIERRCEVCGNPFFAKTLESRYCSEKCGQVAYTRRKREAKKLKKLQELTEQIDDDRDYITVPEAVAMYSVSRTSLYQYIHDGRIPSINLGVRLIRVSRKELEKYFPSAILQYVVNISLKGTSRRSQPGFCQSSTTWNQRTATPSERSARNTIWMTVRYICISENMVFQPDRLETMCMFQSMK